jgi:hypothetical protein
MSMPRSDTHNPDAQEVFSNLHPPNAAVDPAFGSLPHKAAVFEIQCYEILKRAKDIRDFKDKIGFFVRVFGFYDYSYIRLLARSSETQLITTEPQMTAFWLGEALWEHDYLTQYAAANTKPIFQSTIDEYVNRAPFETIDIQKNKLLQGSVKGFGYLDYYNIPLRAGNGNGNVLLSITSRHMPAAEFRRRVGRSCFGLHILARAIDHVGTSKFADHLLDPSESSRVVLRPRAIDLLNTLAWDNLTLNDSAEKLCMSIEMANKHIRAIKEAFQVRTITAALYRAIKLGIVDLE